MKISILTPTYNRADLLPKLYESICENALSYDDVEWLIMDDGSSDDTKKVVNAWKKENKIDIKYYYQKNSGKMIALNHLTPKARGDLIIEVDSDDYILKNSLKTIAKDYKKIKDDKKIYGLLYLKKIIGIENFNNEFNFKENIVSLFDLYYKYDYKYDTTIVFKSEVRKRFVHKPVKQENFITEARMYHEIDKEYKGLFLINKEIIVAEYLDDGYSKNIKKIFKRNPHGYYEYFKELMAFRKENILFSKRIYIIKHFILFSVLINKGYQASIKDVNGLFNKILVSILYWPGKIMTKIKIGG